MTGRPGARPALPRLEDRAGLRLARPVAYRARSGVADRGAVA
jgi:hypothetical protein